MSYIGTHTAQAVLIAQGFSEGLGVAKAFAHPFESSKGQEGAAQIELQIDSLLQEVSTVGEVPQSRQWLIEVGHRLSVRRVCSGLGPGLTAVGHRLLRQLALQRMVGEALGILLASPAVAPAARAPWCR